MWKGIGAKSTLLLLLMSFTLFGVVLSSSSSKSSPTSSTSSYSRRINIRSKSPANLHLQTLRSSRQIPSPPALYSAPKEVATPEAQQAPPPPAYGPPAEDEVSATTETVTEDALEGASTSAPESDGEVIEAENEVGSGTERTEYLPPVVPSTNKRKMGRNRVKDQQMVENSPFHQIQIHVVPPHLSNQQDEQTSDISSYGVPHMMMEFGHDFQTQSQSLQTENGESRLYLPPQGRSAESSPPPHRNEGQTGTYGPQQGREQDDQELAIGLDKTQPPSKEYETPRRDEPQENPANQIYHVPTTFSHSSTNLQNQQGYDSPSQGRAPQSQIRSQYQGQQIQGQQSQRGYPSISQNENQYPQSQSGQGYQEPRQTVNQQAPQFHQSQLQPQPQEQYRGQSGKTGSESEIGYQQPIQMTGQSQGYQSSPFNAPPQYESHQGGYQNQPSFPQQQQQYQDSYSQNHINHEEQQQDDAVVVQGFSPPPQTQFQQQIDYPTTQQNQQSNYAQPQTYASPSQQQHFQQDTFSQPQQSPAQPYQYNAPFESHRQPSPESSPTFGGGYSHQPQNHHQPQPQSPTYDQQPLTSNSNLRQPQQENFPSGSQLSRDGQGYPESRPQPQRNQSPTPAQSDSGGTSATPSEGVSQYFQGNFFSAQPQFRSNSLDFDQMEELEGLNGRIVDAALLARVQQIIDEHEREQKALLANFNNNSPSTSGSNSTLPSSDYGSPFPSTQRQSNYQPAERQQSPNQQRSPTIDENPSGPQLQQRFGGSSPSEGYQTQARPATPSNNNGIQYQKAILQQQFSESSPINNSPVPTLPQRQQSGPQFPQQSASPSTQGEGLKLVQAPQFGPQPQGRENADDVPNLSYGVPLAPVIGLDSNENFKVVDESSQNQGLGQNTYGAPVPNNFLQSRQLRPFYGRNRRRVVGRVRKLTNSSPRVSIPSYFF